MLKKLLITKRGSLLLALAFIYGCTSSNTGESTSSQEISTLTEIIPKPASVISKDNTFELTDETVIITGVNQEVISLGNLLAKMLGTATGFNLEVQNQRSGEPGSTIILNLDSKASQKDAEGYDIAITETSIDITASSGAGLFYGIQTLRQLFPAAIDADHQQDGKWEVPAGTIVDYPHYEWRGAMLDVARHFFSVEDVKRFIDLIALYKINVLHLHLSDDQGWRIEIKSWPNLTKIGGSTEVGGGKGGFYTQEQYKDIVAYAKSRYITIVPEIDLPGHINAALASYPELTPGPRINFERGERNDSDSIDAANKKPIPGKLYTGIEVGFSTLDYNKELSFKFVNDVLRELAAITPGPYLHIGGDEAAVTKKPDYIAFINRFKEIVEANGKEMIGWEEIAQGDIDSSVTVQFWHAQDYAKLAAEKGAKLILSPSKKVYLDMQYDSTTKLGLHWAAYIEVDSSYQWDPAEYIKGVTKDKIRGIEAPLWTETILSMDDIEYMVFPRIAGIAEIGWTQPALREWDDYKKRLASHGKRWEIMEIDFYRSPLIPWNE